MEQFIFVSAIISFLIALIAIVFVARLIAIVRYTLPTKRIMIDKFVSIAALTGFDDSS